MFTLFTVAADKKKYQFGFSSDKKDASGSNNKRKGKSIALVLWWHGGQTLLTNFTQTVFEMKDMCV